MWALGDQPLAKEPKDSGYEIGKHSTRHVLRRSPLMFSTHTLAHAQKTSEGDLRREEKPVPIFKLGLSFGSPSNELPLIVYFLLSYLCKQERMN